MTQRERTMTVLLLVGMAIAVGCLTLVLYWVRNLP